MNKNDIYADINLFKTSSGGRNTPLVSTRPFSCPILFLNVKNLIPNEYFDCRIYVNQYGKNIYPGEKATNIPISFLSPEIVIPNLFIGAKFQIFDGKIVGEGVITRICTKLK